MTEVDPRPRVLKFGGSTLASRDRIDIAVQTVQAAGPSVRAVVVSAPGDLTDHIFELTGSPGDPADEVRLAGALAHGELLGAAVLARALHARGIAARLLRPDEPDWPIITDGEPLRAEIDVDQSRARVQQLLDEATNPPIWVIPGCIGVSREGRKWTSLGRGGGDTTAVALGRCLGVAEVVLVKDVPGVLAADPRAIPDAETLDELSVDEMEALAHGGASVVAPAALRQMGPGMLLRVVGLGASLDQPGGTVIRFDPSPSTRAHGGVTGPLGGSSAAVREPPNWVIVTALPRPRRAGPSDRAGPSVEPDGSHADSPHRPLTFVVPEGDAATVVRQLHQSGTVRAIASRPLGPWRIPDGRGSELISGRNRVPSADAATPAGVTPSRPELASPPTSEGSSA